MTTHLLDNPVWASLTAQHAALAVRCGKAARYPAEVAPFAAVETGDGESAEDLCSLVAVDEAVHLVGVVPPVDARWEIQQQGSVMQMVYTGCVESRPGPQIHILDATHRADMLALAWRVFPGYFRLRTPDMGRYLGIYAGEVLAAMAGERMHPPGCVEISAVCTHPDFLSRGFAARLVAELCKDIIDRGLMPFLHVSPDNARAIALYERLGFTPRADLALWSVRRIAGRP